MIPSVVATIAPVVARAVAGAVIGEVGKKVLRSGINSTSISNGAGISKYPDASEFIPSDRTLKEIHGDEIDTIKKKLSSGKLDKEDTKKLHKLFPAYPHKYGVAYAKDSDKWRDDVLDGYIKYVKNYEYTYKPEATQNDPEIDPTEKHIGILAQDIQKVNPATVKEDESGFMKVDTGRLALMNAGAIAELARRVKEMQNER